MVVRKPSRELLNCQQTATNRGVNIESPYCTESTFVFSSPTLASKPIVVDVFQLLIKAGITRNGVHDVNRGYLLSLPSAHVLHACLIIFALLRL